MAPGYFPDFLCTLNQRSTLCYTPSQHCELPEGGDNSPKSQTEPPSWTIVNLLVRLESRTSGCRETNGGLPQRRTSQAEGGER